MFSFLARFGFDPLYPCANRYDYLEFVCNPGECGIPLLFNDLLAGRQVETEYI